jgi:spoIIIJ-associated protein
MDTRQFTGRSAAEAAIKACEALGVTRSALRYEIVTDTGEGLDRRVTIAVQGMASVAEHTQEESFVQDDVREARPQRQSRPRHADGNRSMSHEDRPRHRDRRGPSDRQRTRSDRSDAEAQEPGIDALLSLDAQPQTSVVRDEWKGPVSSKAERAKATLNQLLRLMGLKEVSVHLIRDEEGEIQIDIAGAEENKVIGHKGDVLVSLQFLLNRMVGREEENDPLIVLDAGGYRERRRQALAELAKRLAERAVQEGKAVRLTPMSAHDRRVFHVTLQDMQGVSTRSEGDGFYKQLYIIPS